MEVKKSRNGKEDDIIIKEIETELQRNNAYLNVLDFFEGRNRTRMKDYYHGRNDVLNKMKEKIKKDHDS
jgi:hypothetical protein